ncbi:hypothetical protein VTJ49DRAFT_4948 [Mycothermus thermophilus]|uniref:Uncharacterized protein n=1 Tax=Humicola insolens TaxID=85995 RepID=A0ABR3VRM7_HUMIN
MFSNLALIDSDLPLAPSVGVVRKPRSEVPPPTPINLPRCFPRASDKEESAAQNGVPRPLPAVLQTIVRPTEVSLSHLEALGLHVVPDADAGQLIPDPAYIPDFEAWNALSADEAHAMDNSTRKPLNATKPSPGCQAYLDRRRELSIPNDDAFRTIRRLPPPKGQPPLRLGNAYEFFRHLELYSAFWDDTSKPATDQGSDGTGPDGSVTDKAPEGSSSNEPEYYRTSAGHEMPVDYRQNMINAFLKLVAFDFACTIMPSRVEPRLQITSKTPSGSPRSSYFSSGCSFIFRAATTREAARAGIVDGPVAAVSARHVTSFPPADSGSDPTASPDRDSTLDLAREIVAALITAQHRAREGRTEKRIGENAWWCTKPRWGGGPGGPIGREVEMLSGEDQTVGDKDAPPPEVPPTSSSSSSRPGSDGLSLPQRCRTSAALTDTSPGSPSKSAKRLKKSGNLPMYDNYRALRPPASTWDKKTRYEAIGRRRGADYDDIFVVSTVLHHVSIVRVRVPDRLLAVLAGEVEDDGSRPRSWGKLEVWRSKWFDFFKVEDRVKALELVWCMLGWMMRAAPPEEKGEKATGGGEEDVKMTGA